MKQNSPCSPRLSGEGIRRGDPFTERAAEDVAQKAGGVRAETYVPGAADQQDPAAVPEPAGGQRATPETATGGKGLTNQRHHQQVISPVAGLVWASTRTHRTVLYTSVRLLTGSLLWKLFVCMYLC